MTFRHVFDHFVKALSSIYDKQEAENITHLIFEEKLGLQRAALIMRENDSISEVKANELAFMLVRLLKGEPVQYVLGYADFYGITFKVNKNVLIPRPETEELVEWIIVNQKEPPFSNIIDIGTGSGCIAVALKKTLPEITVFAVDISEDALMVANENALLNNAEVKFCLFDILNTDHQFSSSSTKRQSITETQFDIIVCNPPYITLSEKSNMHPNVLQFEPHLALFVPDNDPLIYFKAIAAFAENSLLPEGSIYVELNETLAGEVALLFREKGYQQVLIKNDLQGKPRMLRAVR